MATFKYTVGPNSQGTFSARAVIGESVPDDAFLTRAAQLSGSLDKEQIRTAFHAVIDTLLEYGSVNRHSPSLLGRIRFVPTAGGSQAAPGDFNNADEINADVPLSLTAAARDAWRATLSIESQGEVGKVSPHIDSILSLEDGTPNRYAPGTLIILNGDNLRFDKSDATQGVFFRSGSSAEVRATIYGTITPGALTVLVPASLSGPLTVRTAAYINGSVRTFTYMDPITTA